MDAVILAGGKGTRMGVLTQETPKPMLQVAGQPIIQYIVDALPDAIDRVIVVINPQGNVLRDYLGQKKNGKQIVCIENDTFDGTAGALWSAKHLLAGKFLVINADDIYAKSDLENLISYDLAIGIHKGPPPNTATFDLTSDEGGVVAGLRRPEPQETQINIVTGAYCLDTSIFDQTPVAIGGKQEYSLPQTVLGLIKSTPIYAVQMPGWMQMNTPEDLARVEQSLTKK